MSTEKRTVIMIILQGRTFPAPLKLINRLKTISNDPRALSFMECSFARSRSSGIPNPTSKHFLRRELFDYIRQGHHAFGVM